jgi:hypothetical protein
MAFKKERDLRLVVHGVTQLQRKCRRVEEELTQSILIDRRDILQVESQAVQRKKALDLKESGDPLWTKRDQRYLINEIRTMFHLRSSKTILRDNFNKLSFTFSNAFTELSSSHITRYIFVTNSWSTLYVSPA